MPTTRSDHALPAALVAIALVASLSVALHVVEPTAIPDAITTTWVCIADAVRFAWRVLVALVVWVWSQ